jgi:hypothetical protein
LSGSDSGSSGLDAGTIGLIVIILLILIASAVGFRTCRKRALRKSRQPVGVFSSINTMGVSTVSATNMSNAPDEPNPFFDEDGPSTSSPVKNPTYSANFNSSQEDETL